MPELAEVEYGAALARKTLIGATIEEADVFEDTKVLVNVTHQKLKRVLKGAQLTEIRRIGKYIEWTLLSGVKVVIHFGMTGSFRVHGEDVVKLQSHGKEKDAQWPPRFIKFRLKTDAGNELAFVNSRRFGKVWLVENSEGNPLNRLGYDAHDGLPPAKQLFDELQGKKTNLKAKLLDQAWIAGLGNWLVDDILYEAGISPHRRVGELTLDEVKALRKATKSIVEKAVKVEADSTRFPKAWLFHQRWEAKKGGELGAGLLVETIAGRTTVWSPSQQR